MQFQVVLNYSCLSLKDARSLCECIIFIDLWCKPNLNFLYLNFQSDHKPESIQKVANALAKHAHQLAFDPDYMSPFALEAQANGMDMKGKACLLFYCNINISLILGA